MQLCRECLSQLYSPSRILCPVCDSIRLSIPCSENLVLAVTRLLDRGIDVVSASCDIHDVYNDITGNGYIGKSVQIQIELGYLYPKEMFEQLPPVWQTYEYHSIEDHCQIGHRYTGLSHSESFTHIDDVDDELEFATALTISNLESWLDDKDAAGYKATWILAGVL